MEHFSRERLPQGVIRRISALALSLSLACTGCSASEQTTIFNEGTFTPVSTQEAVLEEDQTNALEEGAELARSFWHKKGVDISDTRQVILEGDETAKCTNLAGDTITVTSTATLGPSYCAPEGAVVIDAGFVIQVSRAISSQDPNAVRPYLEYVSLHETAHAAQAVTGTPIAQTTAESKALELAADRYAGCAFSSSPRSPSEIESVRRVLEQYPDDPTHGNGLDRAEAFYRGAHDENCE